MNNRRLRELKEEWRETQRRLDRRQRRWEKRFALFDANTDKPTWLFYATILTAFGVFTAMRYGKAQ